MIKIKHLLQADTNQNGSLSALLLSLSLSIGMYMRLFMLLSDFPLTNFKNRIIGIVSLSGIDAGGRTYMYVLSIIVSLLLFLLLLFVFNSLNRIIDKLIRPLYRKIEQSVLSILSSFSILTILLGIITNDYLPIYISKIFILISVLIYAYLFIKVFALRFNFNLLRFYNNYSISLFILCIAFVLYSCLNIFFYFSIQTVHIPFEFFFISVFFVLILYPLLFKTSSVNIYKLTYSLLLGGIPLILIPFSFPITNEFNFTISNWFLIPSRTLSILVITILLITGIFVFIISTKSTKRLWKPSSIIINWYFPFIIAGLYLLKYYTPILTFSTFDLFHLGEHTLPTHQLFEYGSLPFLDYFPTHGLSNMLYQSLYSAFNGYRGLEMLLWKWVESTIGLILLYFATRKIFSPLFALFLVLFSPVELIFSSYYQIILFPTLVFLFTLKKSTWSHYIVFWLCVFVLFLWRYDMGVAVILSAFFILFFWKIYNRELPVNYFTFKKYFIHAVSFFYVFSFFIFIYIMVILYKGYPLIDILNEWAYYFKIQAQSQSTPQIYSSLTPLVFWQYLFIPFILLSYIGYFLYNSVYRRFQFSPGHVILAFLSVFSLIISIRTVQRHSVIEGYSSLFILFIIGTSGFYFRYVSKYLTQLLFLTCIILYYLVFSSLPTSTFFSIGNTNFIKKGILFSFSDLNKNKSRIILSDSSQFEALTKFFNTNLKVNQTFFDFSNAPLLYVLTNKRFPSYLIPNLYHTSDKVQKFHVSKLDSCLKRGSLPFVIFKQNTWWDNVDDVPQEIRSYRIAEFIYRNYKPYVMIKNFEIWKQKDIEASSLQQPILFHTLASSNYKYFDLKSVSEDSGKISLISGITDPYLFDFLNFNNGIVLDKEKNYSLRFKYTSTTGGSMQFFYSFDGHENFNERYSCRLWLNATNELTEASLQIIKPPNVVTFQNLRFDPPSNSVFSFQDIEFYESDKIPINNRAPQNFDLKLLPYIWGTYDDQKASLTTLVLQEIKLHKMYLNPGVIFKVDFNPDVDKSSGNYLHFRVASNSNGKVILTYGEKIKNTISFDLKPSGKFEDYLIRISSQWSWNSEPISNLTVKSTTRIYLKSVFLRKGD